MDMQSTVPRCSVEEEGLLSPAESTAAFPTLPYPKEEKNNKKSWVLLVGLIFAVVAIVDVGAFLAEPPKTRVFEANLCLGYYREHDPSVIGADGRIPEQLCKVDEVQQRLAGIFGWQEMFDALPGILLAVPFGTLADRVGRKWILTASLVGLQLSSAWVLFICYFKTLPLQLTWFSSAFFVLGGGPIVAMSIAVTVISDIAPPAQRTTIFLYLAACVLIAEMVAPIMAARLMEKGDWLPLLLALAIQQVGVVVGVFFPETLHLRDLPEPRDRDEDSMELQSAAGQFSLTAQLRNFRTAVDFLRSDWTLTLVVFTFLANRLGRQAITLLVRYTSKRYSWEIKKAAYLLSFRAATNLVSITVLIPFVNFLLLKKFRFPVHWADLWIARGSISITAVSFLIMGAAAHPALFILGLLVYNLGTGHNAAMRSIAIHVVGGQSSPDIGKLMSTIAMAESLGAMVAGPLLNAMFQWGIGLGSVWLGLPFLASALVFVGMTAVAFIIDVKDKDKDIAYVEVNGDEEDVLDYEEPVLSSTLDREAATSDAGTRLRRSKSASNVPKRPPSISEPLDLDAVKQQALAAATAAFARSQAQHATEAKAKRSSDVSRSKSNASRKSLTSQGSHFPPRESSFRSQQPPPSTQRQSLAPTMYSEQNTEQFPPFHPTPHIDRPLSVSRPLSTQPSITFSENARPSSQPKPVRQSASSSVTSQQIRKARSMYYASSVQTGSPIARPPAKYLTTPPPPASVSRAPEPSHALPPTRTLRPSPLAGHRIPVTVAANETVDQARDKHLQGFQQKTVKHKPSMFLAPFKKRQDKGKDKDKRVTSGAATFSTSSQQTPDESATDITLNDFLPQPEIKEKRSFSGSLKSKFRRVFRRTSNKSPNLPVQQIEASRDYFVSAQTNPPNIHDAYAIPSPDENILQRVRARTPSLEHACPTFTRSGSRSSSNGSARSLHSEANATHASASRVTSWGTSTTDDTLTQRAIKRLTVIHESKDSIGSEADRVASMGAKRKSLPLPALASFRDPMPMESLTEESLTHVDPKRVFSALMREIGSAKPPQASSSPANRTPGAESDVFESSQTKLHSHTRELHSIASRDIRSSLELNHRPPSRRPESAAAQSAQSKSSTIRSLGRAIRSTIRTVTPTEHRSSSRPGGANNVRGAARTQVDDADTPSPTNNPGSEGSSSSDQSAGRDYSTLIFTPSATQIQKRVARAKDRWKSPLEEAEQLQFPRETGRTYNVTNFVQETTTYETPRRSLEHIEPSRTDIQDVVEQHTYQSSVPPQGRRTPAPQPTVSPMSPSIYSRNTDGISIPPNDSVMSFQGPSDLERSHDGGSAVILTSQSVRSYVVGTPSPRRTDMNRTSRDWRSWLSHEISGMELSSQEDLTIHEQYKTPSGLHRRDTIRTSHTEHDDTTVVLRESCEITAPRPEFEDSPTNHASGVVGYGMSGQQSKDDTKATTPVLGKSISHANTYKEVSPIHTPITSIAGEDDTRRFSQPRSTPLLSRPRLPPTPNHETAAPQPALETPNSSRMNERFPFLDTGRRSSSNSVASCQSKSPTDSVTSPKSMMSPKATPGPKLNSDVSAPATNETSQRVPHTALKRSDAQHKRKENITPPSLRSKNKATASPLGLSMRPTAQQPLSSTTPNRSSPNAGQYAAINETKHNSSPTGNPPRPRIRTSLRTLSPEKLARRPRSAFDLRGTNGLGRANLVGLTTAAPRPSSDLRRPALHMKTSSHSLAMSRSSGAEESRLDVERSGSVTPGQRMADRFLKERKSTPALESADLTARTPLTPDELSQAREIEVFDREGRTKTLGELIKGKRSVLVFIRHFWCLNCQAYLRLMSESIPPSSLPPNTQSSSSSHLPPPSEPSSNHTPSVLVIGCGSYQPIDTYATASSCLYPIFTDPTLRLHSILGFKSNLAEGQAGDETRDYMRDAGGPLTRIWGGIKGAVANVQHLNYVGPKALNGGEVVVSTDGACEYIYRMQNTVDHTDISEISKLISVQVTPETGKIDKTEQEVCG
ncbi:hypothetical protein EJ02DRAFT_510656 [Clathrospora elynae]|uniref:Major facilitator superfamily (MFS) profile domain-containing protein n=1 Tax=Clathrospora elynae TaxID=706981 RepID=A0A6A5SX63_9PLEO|nr:hypothetical protein EJ02DRAFT_510656 [Clathrospora elynae]